MYAFGIKDGIDGCDDVWDGIVIVMVLRLC